MPPLLQMEESAHQSIYQLLSAAGLQVCDPQETDITAHRGVAIREFSFAAGQDFVDYPFYIDGQAGGVIEAKREGVTPATKTTSASIPSSARFPRGGW